VYINKVGLYNPGYNVTGLNKIFNTGSTGEAAISYTMPETSFDVGNNIVQISWGIFPSADSSDLSLVRGADETMTIYNSFSFEDMYD